MSSPTGNGGDDAVTTPGEEGILVAIRMRPLNNKESNTNNNRVWRVLQKYNSITQCTPSGKPLLERFMNHTFFEYDKAFGETSSTHQIYEATSQGIVKSVAAEGKNGTIFAYGQTSSGKTFTMQGSGTIQEGAANNAGGIVHMAASEIFNHIEKEPERVFLVRVSFIEIYNEEVRDLLVSGDATKDDATLTIFEDLVGSNETIVTSMNSLLSVLFSGEKNRSVAATGMNERSSRSHTIFRITVESRLKEDGKDEEEEAVRISTLNLVDLAGSESVRHTGNTGERQKEGGKINQTLLTLSRVIGSLGQNATHVNFRDSKLTRILQPSLSGNARMVVICCTTPSELHLEETRSTLQFASRAKLVKTRAQVNEVMDDRSLMKKLQRDLKEARKGGPDSQTMEHQRMIALRSWLFTFTQLDNYRQSDVSDMDDNAYKEDFNNLDFVTAVVRITEEIFECDETTFIPPVSVDEAWAMIHSMLCVKGLLSSTDDISYNDLKDKYNILSALLCHAMYKCASRKAYLGKLKLMRPDRRSEIVIILRAYKNKNESSDSTNSNSDGSIEHDNNNSTGDEDDTDVKMNAADSNKLEERGERDFGRDPPAFDEASQLRKLLQESIARESTLKKENEDLTSKLKESEAGRAMVQNEMNLLVSLLR